MKTNKLSGIKEKLIILQSDLVEENIWAIEADRPKVPLTTYLNLKFMFECKRKDGKIWENKEIITRLEQHHH